MSDGDRPYNNNNTGRRRSTGEILPNSDSKTESHSSSSTSKPASPRFIDRIFSVFKKSPATSTSSTIQDRRDTTLQCLSAASASSVSAPQQTSANESVCRDRSSRESTPPLSVCSSSSQEAQLKQNPIKKPLELQVRVPEASKPIDIPVCAITSQGDKKRVKDESKNNKTSTNRSPTHQELFWFKELEKMREQATCARRDAATQRDSTKSLTKAEFEAELQLMLEEEFNYLRSTKTQESYDPEPSHNPNAHAPDHKYEIRYYKGNGCFYEPCGSPVEEAITDFVVARACGYNFPPRCFLNHEASSSSQSDYSLIQQRESEELDRMYPPGRVSTEKIAQAVQLAHNRHEDRHRARQAATETMKQQGAVIEKKVTEQLCQQNADSTPIVMAVAPLRLRPAIAKQASLPTLEVGKVSIIIATTPTANPTRNSQASPLSGRGRFVPSRQESPGRKRSSVSPSVNCQLNARRAKASSAPGSVIEPMHSDRIIHYSLCSAPQPNA